MIESPFERIRKPASLKRLSRPGGRREPLWRMKLEEISREKTTFDTGDDWEQRVARDTNNPQLARRLSSLRRRYPYGTVPELIMLDWLERRNERYIYQAQLFGGWVKGGVVPDFVLPRHGRATAVFINGNFWHDRPGKREKDRADKMRVLGEYVGGVKVTQSVIVWESRLLRDPDETMESAVAGFELGV